MLHWLWLRLLIALLLQLLLLPNISSKFELMSSLFTKRWLNLWLRYLLFVILLTLELVFVVIVVLPAILYIYWAVAIIIVWIVPLHVHSIWPDISIWLLFLLNLTHISNSFFSHLFFGRKKCCYLMIGFLLNLLLRHRTIFLIIRFKTNWFIFIELSFVQQLISMFLTFMHIHQPKWLKYLMANKAFVTFINIIWIIWWSRWWFYFKIIPRVHHLISVIWHQFWRNYIIIINLKFIFK